MTNSYKILETITAMLGVDCEISERESVTAIEIEVRPRTRNDFLRLVGHQGATFRQIKTIAAHVAEPKELAWGGVSEPFAEDADTKHSLPPGSLDLFELVGLIFGENCYCAKKEFGNRTSLVISEKTSMEKAIKGLFATIGKVHGKIIEVTFIPSADEPERDQPESADGDL